MSSSTQLSRIASSMPASARRALEADPVLQGKLLRVYGQHPDLLGKTRGEVRCQPSLEWSRRKMRRLWAWDDFKIY